MSYLNFSRQLMENKRRSRLTGRQDTSRYQEASDRRSGAADRLATGRSITQANENQTQRNQFAADLAKQKADFETQQAELRAKYGSQTPSEPLGNPVYDDGGALQTLIDWFNYKSQYPAATRLDANDPRLRGIARDEVPGGTLAPPANQFDTSAFNPDNYDPGLSLEEKYALYLKSLKNPTAAATSSGGTSEM
jgi:hypothetical protein